MLGMLSCALFAFVMGAGIGFFGVGMVVGAAWPSLQAQHQDLTAELARCQQEFREIRAMRVGEQAGYLAWLASQKR